MYDSDTNNTQQYKMFTDSSGVSHSVRFFLVFSSSISRTTSSCPVSIRTQTNKQIWFLSSSFTKSYLLATHHIKIILYEKKTL